MASYEHLSVGQDAGVATITINRPDRLNALTGRTIRELLDVLRGINTDDEIRAAVITGAGRAFCAGIDMGGGERTFRSRTGSNAADADPADAAAPTDTSERFVDISGPLALALYRSRKPIVGAVNGAAVGVGATMTLPMDVRLASTEARFAFPFTRRGISPDACSSWFLPRVVGISRALEWSLGGQFVPAESALQAGLVRSVHAADDLEAAAFDVARDLSAHGAPVSIAITRRLMWRMLGSEDPAQAHDLESLSLGSRGTSADAKEGVRAFLEKRTPNFPETVSQDLPDWFSAWDAP